MKLLTRFEQHCCSRTKVRMRGGRGKTIVFVWSFFSLLSEGKETHEEKVISPITWAIFFFISIWWFMLKERYISALLVLRYHVLSYWSRVTSMCFFCVACIILTEFKIFLLFLWEIIIWGMSPISSSQYLFDLKVHWITWYYTKGGKLLKCNVNSKRGYLKCTNFR